MSKFLDSALDFARARFSDANGEFLALPITLQTAIRVESMQGIIDNGGLQYFFEADFPEKPPYSLFVNDLRRINATDQARYLQQAIECFSFANPHLDCERRNEELERLWATENDVFVEANSQLCGNEDVWVKLEGYIADNVADFRDSQAS